MAKLTTDSGSSPQRHPVLRLNWQVVDLLTRLTAALAQPRALNAADQLELAALATAGLDSVVALPTH